MTPENLLCIGTGVLLCIGVQILAAIIRRFRSGRMPRHSRGLTVLHRI